MLALPFILQGLSMRGSLMGGWKNSLSAIPQLVQVISRLDFARISTRSTFQGYMERKSPNLDVLVTKDIRLEDINQAFTDLSSTGNQDLRIRINFPA